MSPDIIYRQSLDFSLLIQQVACKYFDAGLNVIPIKNDGSKKPDISWKRFETERVNPSCFSKWWCFPMGIAIICGPISGNLEVLDFDEPKCFPYWQDLIKADSPTLLASLPIVGTPSGGRHVCYRCSVIEGNKRLARSERGETLIETRGDGGYIIAPGSPPTVHPERKLYRLLQGDLCNIPTITPEERALLLSTATEFDLYAPCEPEQTPTLRRDRAAVLAEIKDLFGENALPFLPKRPGDDFNERATWSEILEPHGWVYLGMHGQCGSWRRPGKNEGSSATTNYENTGLLKVFSSSTIFDPEKAYTKFAAYAILNHGGDFIAAAKDLAAKGFGD